MLLSRFRAGQLGCEEACVSPEGKGDLRLARISLGMSVCGRALCFPGSVRADMVSPRLEEEQEAGTVPQGSSWDPHKSLALGSQRRAAVPSRVYRAASTGKSGFCEGGASRENPQARGHRD